MKTQQTEHPILPTTRHKSQWRGYSTPPQAQPQDAASHSPLPWHIVIEAAHLTPRINSGTQGVARIIDSKHYKGDAAYIVRACNNVQRLADALKPLINVCDLAKLGLAGAVGYRQLKNAREALAQWEQAQ